MADLLQLTPEQQTRFRQIMAESRKQLFQLQHEQSPKIQAIRNETNRKLIAILNQEQQKRFESFLKEMESWRRRGPGGPQFGPSMRPMQQPRDGR
jgi:Spy/CpxP family protein refolding chaperone